MRRNGPGLLVTGAVPAETFLSGELPLAETIEALELMGRQQGIKDAIVPNPGLAA